MRIITLILFILWGFSGFAQQFFRSGAEGNIETTPEFGILIAGGATDNNNAMQWLTRLANGGDVVVLRADGEGGYNNYILNDLGIEVNSVTTILIQSPEEADNPLVCEEINKSDLVFIAGGNQWNYYSQWKNTCLQVALNNHVNVKNAPLGGTSAGAAILGEVLFTAENNTVWTEEALGNPYHWRVKLANDFLELPFLASTITDSHYNRIEGDDNTRHGRHLTFLARMITDWDMNAKGIGVNEYTAVAVQQDGIARVFGDPSHDDNAYFINAISYPEICESGEPLTWYHNKEAAVVYKLKGDRQASNSFDLNNWENGEGGSWWMWYVKEGELYMIEAETLDVEQVPQADDVKIFPSPASDYIYIHTSELANFDRWTIFSLDGKAIKTGTTSVSEKIEISLSPLQPGAYILVLKSTEGLKARKFIKQ